MATLVATICRQLFLWGLLLVIGAFGIIKKELGVWQIKLLVKFLMVCRVS